MGNKELKDIGRGLIGAIFVSTGLFCFVIAIIAIFFSALNFNTILSTLYQMNAGSEVKIYAIGIFGAVLLAFFEIFRYGNSIIKIGQDMFVKNKIENEKDKFWREYNNERKNRI